MKIEGKQAESFSRSLEQALQQGYRYAATTDEKSKDYQRPASLQFFKEKSEALQYSHTKRSNEGIIIDAIPVLALKEQLDRKMELQQVSSPGLTSFKDVVLDTGLIKFQEKARGAIFAEDVIRQLKAHQILPDQKALKRNIEEDKTLFDITGARRENGTDKQYLIRVQQDEYRAFTIQSIREKQYSMQQIKSDGLQLTLLREDVKDLQTFLQREKENGNRFLSFPSAGVLTKEGLAVFKSAFEALEHAQRHGTAREPYAVRSVLAMETEINKLPELKGEHQIPLKETERIQLKETERIQRSPRAQELSR